MRTDKLTDEEVKQICDKICVDICSIPSRGGIFKYEDVPYSRGFISSTGKIYKCRMHSAFIEYFVNEASKLTTFYNKYNEENDDYLLTLVLNHGFIKYDIESTFGIMLPIKCSVDQYNSLYDLSLMLKWDKLTFLLCSDDDEFVERIVDGSIRHVRIAKKALSYNNCEDIKSMIRQLQIMTNDT